MRLFLAAAALAFAAHGCGGSAFSDSVPSQPGADAGEAGAHDASAGGGAGQAGSAGAGTGGAAGGAAGGGAGEAGSSVGGSPPDAGPPDSGELDAASDAALDAGPSPIQVVQTSPLKLSQATEPVSTGSMLALPKAGNAIIVGISCISDVGFTDAGGMGDCTLADGNVTDTDNNAYARVLQSEPIKSSTAAARGYLFVAGNISVGNSAFTIAVDPQGASSAQAVAWVAIEVAGLQTPLKMDRYGISLVGKSTSTTAAISLPTQYANELAVALLTVRANDTDMMITPDLAWTSHHLHNNSTWENGNPPGHSLVSRVLATKETVSHTWSHDVPDRGAAAVIATFPGALQP
jgi:hypothetical protein